MILFICIILSLFIGYLLIGIFNIRQNTFIKSINSIEKGSICLTFDDGPDHIMTPKILNILKKYNVKANFFLIGSCLLENENIVKRIHSEGHTIGCHTFNHKPTFPIYSKKRMEYELVKTNNLIKSITSDNVVLFRPPFGITTPIISKVLINLKMISVGWDIRSLDTITSNPIQLFKRVKKGIDHGGTVILFHDRCDSSLVILEKVILYCFEKELTFKTIQNA